MTRASRGTAIILAATVTLVVGSLVLTAGCGSSGDPVTSPVAWRVSLQSLGAPADVWWSGEPVVADDLAFVDIGSGIVALDVTTGTVRWNVQPWPNRRIAGTRRLVARDGRLYAVDFVLNRAVALDVTDGATLWAAQLDTLSEGGFQVAADSRGVYVATNRAEVLALDAASGVERWRTSLQTAGRRNALLGAVTDGEVVYVAGARKTGDCPYCTEAMTTALATVTGAIVWQHFEGDSASDAGAAPTVASEVLVASGAAHGLIARDRATGATRWRVPGAEEYIAMLSPPLVLGDTVVVGDGPVLYAVRLSTGAPLYSTELRSSIRYIASCGGKVLVSRQALDMVDAATHRVLGTWLDDEYGRDGFITSGFGVSGDRAVVAGNRQVFGMRCR